jgi:lipopolysaccharide export system permease protein
MSLSRILARYTLAEVAQYTVLGFLVFATILLTQNVLRILGDLTSAVGATPSDFGWVVLHLLPVLVTYALPVSFLFGVLLGVARMASDSEVLAMRACGFGLRQLVVPVVAVGFLVSLGTAWLMIDVEHKVRKDLRMVLKRVASRSLGLEGGGFRTMGKRVLFVDRRDKEGNLNGVAIWDRSNPSRPFAVFAEIGRVTYDSESAVVNLFLERGDVHLEPSREEPDRYRRIVFETFDYSFGVSEFLAGEAARVQPRDMSMAELRANLERVRAAQSPLEIADLREKDPKAYEMQMQRRYALPVAPVLFALVGVPLGLRRVRGARSAGAMMCAGLVFLYYALLSFAEFLGTRAGVPPALAIWLPNVAFLALSIPLLQRARRGEL